MIPPLQEKFDSILKASRFSRLLVGLSGGADSVALLHLLTNSELYKTGRLRIKCVHCNFNLRGDESLRDEHFCRDLCRESGVELETADFDAAGEANRRGVSAEVACRDLRYDRFRELMASQGWERVAVAHHQDDNAETLLLNLMRGSGLNGLKGMIPDNGEVYRPLLSFSRAEILEYLDLNNQSYIVDSSNLESEYRRNFLRLEIIPLLESRWPAAKKMMARSAEILAREGRLLDSKLRKGAPGDKLFFRELNESADPFTEVYYFIKGSGGSASIAAEIRNSIDSEEKPGGVSGKWWRLDSGLRVSLEREYIEILPENPKELPKITESKFEVTPDLLSQIRENRNPAIAWMPVSLSELTVRATRQGDRIRLPKGGTTLVSKLMKDNHYSRSMKESTPVVVLPDGEIAWVGGLRRSAVAYVSPDDKAAYRLEIQKDTGNPAD